MLKFIITLILVPLPVFIYTVSFARWMQKKQQRVGMVSAYVLAVVTVALSTVVLWRLAF